jgi:hypothetical protein
MTCIFLQDWRLVKVAGGLVCLGVSMSFMSIFDTARCLERLSMPGPGLGQLNPWVKRVFFCKPHHGSHQVLLWKCQAASTFSCIERHDLPRPRHWRSHGDLTDGLQFARFLMPCYLPSWPTKTGGPTGAQGCSYVLHSEICICFFFPHHITVCLNLSWRGRVRCWNIAQLDGLHQIVSDRKVGLWSSGFSPGNSTGFHPIPTSQSNLAAFESQVVQYRSGALFTHNTSSLTNSLA